MGFPSLRHSGIRHRHGGSGALRHRKNTPAANTAAAIARPRPKNEKTDKKQIRERRHIGRFSRILYFGGREESRGHFMAAPCAVPFAACFVWLYRLFT